MTHPIAYSSTHVYALVNGKLESLPFTDQDLSSLVQVVDRDEADAYADNLYYEHQLQEMICDAHQSFEPAEVDDLPF